MNARVSTYILASLAIAVVIAAAVLHCIMPLTAVAVAAGIALPKRHAIAITFGTWIVSQIYGFAFLHFSHSVPTLIAGVSLGLGAIAATLLAETIAHGRIGISSLGAFIAGFAAYQLVTYAFSLFIGGSDLYALPIQAHIFAVNALFFIPLLAIAYAAFRLETAPVSSRL